MCITVPAGDCSRDGVWRTVCYGSRAGRCRTCHDFVRGPRRCPQGERGLRREEKGSWLVPSPPGQGQSHLQEPVSPSPGWPSQRAAGSLACAVSGLPGLFLDKGLLLWDFLASAVQASRPCPRQLGLNLRPLVPGLALLLLLSPHPFSTKRAFDLSLARHSESAPPSQATPGARYDPLPSTRRRAPSRASSLVPRPSPLLGRGRPPVNTLSGRPSAPHPPYGVHRLERPHLSVHLLVTSVLPGR